MSVSRKRRVRLGPGAFKAPAPAPVSWGASQALSGLVGPLSEVLDVREPGDVAAVLAQVSWTRGARLPVLLSVEAGRSRSLVTIRADVRAPDGLGGSVERSIEAPIQLPTSPREVVLAVCDMLSRGCS